MIGLVNAFGADYQRDVSEIFKQETGPSHPNDWICDEYKFEPALKGGDESK
jgi:hypothetical protein